MQAGRYKGVERRWRKVEKEADRKRKRQQGEKGRAGHRRGRQLGEECGVEGDLTGVECRKVGIGG